MVVRFCGTESTFAYFEATREYIEQYGKPLAFYSDKASVFRINKTQNLHLADNSENLRLIRKYIDVLQFPDGRIDIRVGGQSLPYSTYDRVSVVDQGSVVNHKRLSHALQAAQILQAQRDDRVVNKPSTAHRSDGMKVPRKKVHGTRSQRELGYDDLHAAIQALSSSNTSIDEVV